METRYVNERGDEIPSHIAKKAREMGCLKPKYIYKDGQYSGKFPASNLYTDKATRFRACLNIHS